MKIPSGVNFSNAHKHYDDAAALRDGWRMIREPGGVPKITAEGDVFATDAEALHYVAQRAWEGSPLHEAVMISIKRSDPQNIVAQDYIDAVKDSLKTREYYNLRATDQDVAAPFRKAMDDPEVRVAWARVHDVVKAILGTNRHNLDTFRVQISLIKSATISNFKNAFACECAEGRTPQDAADVLLAGLVCPIETPELEDMDASPTQS